MLFLRECPRIQPSLPTFSASRITQSSIVNCKTSIDVVHSIEGPWLMYLEQKIGDLPSFIGIFLNALIASEYLRNHERASTTIGQSIGSPLFQWQKTGGVYPPVLLVRWFVTSGVHMSLEPTVVTANPLNLSEFIPFLFLAP
jgi:hypothetical protein